MGEFLYVGSHRGALRVTIVHPAEAMNPNAANALLKALEEPPANAVFILVSHEPARLLPTVRSRCVRVVLALPDGKSAAAWLKTEQVQDPERWLAFAGGAPLLALEYAKGDRANERARMFDALAGGTAGSLAINDREALELLAEVLQKRACDLAFSALAGRQKYGSGPVRKALDPRALLAFAREMGRNRALARRPLNPRLFGAELLARYAELSDS
jgi:DNA polymerase-3 subunit delta'